MDPMDGEESQKESESYDSTNQLKKKQHRRPAKKSPRNSLWSPHILKLRFWGKRRRTSIHKTVSNWQDPRGEKRQGPMLLSELPCGLGRYMCQRPGEAQEFTPKEL